MSLLIILISLGMVIHYARTWRKRVLDAQAAAAEVVRRSPLTCAWCGAWVPSEHLKCAACGGPVDPALLERAELAAVTAAKAPPMIPFQNRAVRLLAWLFASSVLLLVVGAILGYMTETSAPSRPGVPGDPSMHGSAASSPASPAPAAPPAAQNDTALPPAPLPLGLAWDTRPAQARAKLASRYVSERRGAGDSVVQHYSGRFMDMDAQAIALEFCDNRIVSVDVSFPRGDPLMTWDAALAYMKRGYGQPTIFDVPPSMEEQHRDWDRVSKEVFGGKTMIAGWQFSHDVMAVVDGYLPVRNRRAGGAPRALVEVLYKTPQMQACDEKLGAK